MPRHNILKSDIVRFVVESFSEREVLRKLKLNPNGGYKNIRKAIKECDVSHFTGPGWNKGKILPQ